MTWHAIVISNLCLGGFELWYPRKFRYICRGEMVNNRRWEVSLVMISMLGLIFKSKVQNFDILAGNNDEPVIAIHPSSSFVPQNSDSKQEEHGIYVLNGLCRKVSSFNNHGLFITEHGDEFQLFSGTNSILYSK